MEVAARQEQAPPFKTPKEELAFLREQVARKERELEGYRESDGLYREQATREAIQEYGAREPREVLHPASVIPEAKADRIVLDLSPEAHDARMSELIALLDQHGIKNTLLIVEKMRDPHIEDDFHRLLVEYLKEGYVVPGLKEGAPLWRALHMTLYEITLPETREEETKQRALKELLSSMEQFYAGMCSVAGHLEQEKQHFTLEIAVADKSDDIVFYAAVPDNKRDLFEKHILSIFPHAALYIQKNDYNVFVEGGTSLGSYAKPYRSSALPLKLYDRFDYDPLNSILNAFSKIERVGGGAALQIVFNPVGGGLYLEQYRRVLKDLKTGVPAKNALKVAHTFGDALAKEFFSLFKGEKDEEKRRKEEEKAHQENPKIIEAVERKASSPIMATNIRLVASATTERRAKDILLELESVFNQFEDTEGNRLTWNNLTASPLSEMLNAFAFRDFLSAEELPLSLKEAATILHFPPEGIASSPQFKQARAQTAPAPMNLLEEGTLLGTNRFRNTETNIYLSKEDRLRHLYVIGQTGTGKTTFLKNMIAQDIAQGDGVCMIDPHGTDIVDVLGMIPESRYKDVIYFDPSYMPRVMGLNMLEYDTRFPEQKTFVVNELFSIFMKLYGSVPESMGPMFEQYFRNATMLVIEHPESGNTLFDVSRVLADAAYRDYKLTMCKNPVISLFWKQIATKAGGEQSLANIVPYITSKFDVFLANEIMRPIIAQEHSTFDFRRIMDERKILLVNLAKGRLGDINSNLLGLIIVGKILMAALSRVDARDRPPPFYLYIDEFQNVTTDSIATILSEARKYKLSLTVAHQFIAQLDEKIRDAVFGNVGSMAVFRVGADDAEFLHKQLSPVFTANDLLNIENRSAYLRILANGTPQKPFNISVSPPPEIDRRKTDYLKELSYQTYGTPREEVERKILEKYQWQA